MVTQNDKNEVTQVLFLHLRDHRWLWMDGLHRGICNAKGSEDRNASEASMNDSGPLWIPQMSMDIWVHMCPGSNCIPGGFSDELCRLQSSLNPETLVGTDLTFT